MSKAAVWCAAAVLACAGAMTIVSADRREATLAVVMTNDPDSNQLQVYDAATHALLQTLSTYGRGAVGGNARGVRQLDGEIIAAVNNGSNSVAVFRRDGNGLKFEQVIATTSAPVSVDFGNDHLYVAGATTADSFVLRNHKVGWRDGTALLEVAEGGAPPAGSTAQVGVVDAGHLLVTLKTDPTPGTVDVVALDGEGAVTGLASAVPAPAGTLTPFGFSAYGDGTALITLAHSNQDGLFRDAAFVTVIGAGQAAPCWTTRAGKYVFSANTGSKTISRLVGTGSNVFIDAPAAATIVTGGAPLDIDSNAGVLGVIDHGAGRSHLSLFTYNQLGELTTLGSPIDLNVPNANGVAIVRAAN
jgi:hypothetical protein